MACKKPPIRFWIAVMIFMSVFMNYVARVSMSISIIAMVKPKSGTFVPECSRDKDSQDNSTKPSNEKDTGPRYVWSEQIQGIILGAYFYGYILASIPAGLLAERFGPRLIIYYSSGITVILLYATVLAAHIHWGALVGVRVCIGLMGGLLYPALQCLISHWAPPAEKGKFLGCLMGSTLGAVVALPLVAAITEMYGWDWGFYVPAFMILVYTIVFGCLVRDYPEDHFLISEEEKNYINESQKGTISKKKAIPPYLKMFGSIRFLVLCLAQFGNMWGLFLIVTNIPKFMAQVLGFNLKESGVLSALPYLARLIFGFFFGWLGDLIFQKELMSKTATRKFFTIFSHLLPAAMLFCITFVGCFWQAVVGLLFMCQGLNGAVAITISINPHDLAPNFAGSIFGLMSSFGGTTGIIVPALTGVLTNKNNGLAEWHWVFRIGSLVYMICGLIFMLFGTGEIQPWNKKEDD